MRVIIIRTL